MTKIEIDLTLYPLPGKPNTLKVWLNIAEFLQKPYEMSPRMASHSLSHSGQGLFAQLSIILREFENHEGSKENKMFTHFY